MKLICLPLVLPAFLAAFSCFAQQTVTSIVTDNSTLASVSHTAVKGAGLRYSDNSLISFWDSTGTNFTVNFNSGADDRTSITQLSVTGHANPLLPMVLSSASVKVRRLANALVNDTRNHFNFWTLYNTVPATGALSGTFSLMGPEITDPEVSLLTNNLNCGYDNIFSNISSSGHAGNIERLDYIFSNGLVAYLNSDLDASGTVVFDRGTGDAFKIAAILSLDGSGNPLTFGPVVSVTAPNFGPNLRAINVATIMHDPNYGSKPRPSGTFNQNTRGVFMSLRDLGIAVNQRFYGYVLFAPDVPALTADWTSYPNNTNNSGGLDMVNLMGIFKEATSVLASPVIFNLEKQNNKAVLRYSISDHQITSVAIERSMNGRDFSELARIPAVNSGNYSYTDEPVQAGISFYRLKAIFSDGTVEYSETKSIWTSDDGGMQISPNPARSFVTVSLPPGWQQKKITASLFAPSGTRLRSHDFRATAGTYTISLQGIEPGTYFLQLRNAETGVTETKTLIMTR